MIHRGLSWDEDGRKRLTLGVFAALILAGFGGVTPGAGSSVDVVVRESEPATTVAEELVRAIGGAVKTQIEVIGGFTATIPAAAFSNLAADPAVAAVTPDIPVALHGRFGEALEASTQNGSMAHVAQTVGAESFWGAGYTGQGVTVALIDSGTVPVTGLTNGTVINGLDISFDSQSDTFRHLDTFGHGTHMAGIIAGRDQTGNQAIRAVDPRYFDGIAPHARILSVKVASYDGAVDVSQVLAAIDWVVQHRDDNGMNVRILNLSFGTTPTQSAVLDPLSHAVEQAWKKGIVVVAAVGNDGNGVAVRNPAVNPYVIAVGAANTQGTLGRLDDTVATFSNCTPSGRSVDLLAPGVSIVSLRSPNGFADLSYPSARVGERFFKGTGTSQSTAVVSGAAALIIQKYPSATPDQVKALLMSGAQRITKGNSRCEGAGLIDLERSMDTPLPIALQNHGSSTGVGTLEGARGTDHLTNDGVTLTGEIDIFGKPFSTVIWAPASAAGSSWSGGTWSGSSWSGSSWSGSSWSGSSWSGSSWSGSSWSGSSWSGSSWSDMSWSGSSWSGSSWSGSSWSGSSWSGSSWSGHHWE